MTFRHVVSLFGVMFGFSCANAQVSQPMSLPEHALLRIGDTKFHGGGHRMRFTADGKTLAIADREKLRLLDPNTGQERHVFAHMSKSIPKSTNPTRQDVVEFAFMANSKAIATADLVGVLRIWHTESGKETRLAGTHPGVATLCVSSDEKTLFTAGFDGMLNEWTLPAGALKQSWSAPAKEAILAIALFGKQLAVVTRDGVLLHWDPMTGKHTKSFELGILLIGENKLEFGSRVFPSKGAQAVSFAIHPRNIEFSRDGKRLAQIQGQQIWDVESGKTLCNLPPNQSLVRFQFSFDNKTVAVGPTGLKDSMQLFDATSGERKAILQTSRIDALAFAPDGKTVAFAADKRVRFWKSDSMEVVGGGGAIDVIKDWDISPDARHIAIATKEKAIQIFDLETGKEKERFNIAGNAGDLVRFDADGKSLLVAVSNQAIHHFEKKDMQWTATKSMPVKQQIHPTRGPGFFTLTGTSKNPLDLRTGKQPRAWPKGDYAHLIQSASGRHVMVAAEVPIPGTSPTFPRMEKQYQVYELPSWKLLRSFKSTERGLLPIRFSPDGRLFLVDSNPIKIREVLTGTERASIEVPYLRQVVEFSPDGDSLIIGKSDGSVTVVGLPKGQEIRRVNGAHAGGVNGVRSIFDNRIVTVGSDRIVMVWSDTLWKGPVAPAIKLEAEDYDIFYKAIDGKTDANVASAMTSLIAGGNGTVLFLKSKLAPVQTEDVFGPKAEMPLTRIRDHRAIEILERIGTPPAYAVLETLSKGHAGAHSTIEALESLARLNKKRTSK